MMGIIGGEYDEQTKEVKFNPNKTILSNMQVYSENDVISDLDIPAISKWIELAPIKEIKDSHISQDYTIAGVRTPTKITFYSQGMIIRHRIRENKSLHNLSVNGFKVVSTAFTFKSIANISSYLNGRVSADAGARNAKILDLDYNDFYVDAVSNNAEKFLPSSNGGANEYVQDFNLASPLKIAAGANAEDKLMVFWAMPTKVRKALRNTNIYLNASIDGATVVSGDMPKMSLLSVYGSKHKSVPELDNQRSFTSGHSAIMTSTIERPKLAIEYMDEYNLKSKQQVYAIRNGVPVYGNQFDNSLATERATAHDWTSTSALRYYTAVESVKQNFQGYHMPTYEEFCGILPFTILDNTGNTIINFTPNRPASEKTSKSLKGKGLQLQIKNQRFATEGSVWNMGNYNDPNSYSYAVLFENWNGDNKMRVAYRYSYQNATDANVLGMGATYPEIAVMP